MPGMRDVAKECGVALSTVSAILNDDNTKFVSDELRQRVMCAVEKLQYKMPQKKQEKALPMIAVVLPRISSSFFPTVLAGIEHSANQHEYQLLYFDSNSRFEKEKSIIETLKLYQISGLIIDSLCFENKEEDYLAYLKETFLVKKKIPVVFLERSIASDDFYSVSVDDEHNAYLATSHLIECGRQHIAHIAGAPNFGASEKRKNGYLNALEAHGIACNANAIVDGDFTPMSGYIAMKKLLAFGLPIDGLFVANDQMAIGAMRALKESKKQIPTDVAVVGFDNISHASLVEPALTTIDVPLFTMGFHAAEMIANAAAQVAQPKHIALRTELIVRNSTKATAFHEWDLLGW